MILEILFFKFYCQLVPHLHIFIGKHFISSGLNMLRYVMPAAIPIAHNTPYTHSSICISNIQFKLRACLRMEDSECDISPLSSSFVPPGLAYKQR